MFSPESSRRIRDDLNRVFPVEANPIHRGDES